MQYDFAGRLVFNQFNREYGNIGKRIYEQAIQYDAFSQMTSRQITYWDNDGGGFTATYVNGRKQDNTLSFDASGNITAENHATNEFQNMYFDASGRRTGHLERWHTNNGPQSTFIVWENKTEEVFDGDGRPVIEKKGMRQINQTTVPPMTTSPYLFQVWSSVLGESLTTVTPDGNKFETKVFAGGAVIAKQNRFVNNNQNYDSIDWVTNDPVTGTTGKFSYTSSGSVRVTEEIEPLGQKISPHDPSPDEPIYYQTHLFSAGDAEWQCQLPEELYGSYISMPDRCGDAIYMPKGPEKKSNPIKVPHRDPGKPPRPTDPPASAVTSSLSFGMMSYALESTAKGKDSGDGCTRGGGRWDCVVQSEPYRESPIEDYNAEFGGNSRTIKIDGVKLKVQDLPNKKRLENDFNNRMKNKKCKDAMDDLAKKLGYKNGLAVLFQNILNNNNLLESLDYFKNIFPKTSKFYYAGAASSAKENAIVFSRTDHNSQDQENELITLFHELLHLAGKGASHTKIANAMFELSTAWGDEYPVTVVKQNTKINKGMQTLFIEPADSKAKGFNQDDVNTNYMDKWIQTYCPK